MSEPPAVTGEQSSERINLAIADLLDQVRLISRRATGEEKFGTDRLIADTVELATRWKTFSDLVKEKGTIKFTITGLRIQ